MTWSNERINAACDALTEADLVGIVSSKFARNYLVEEAFKADHTLAARVFTLLCEHDTKATRAFLETWIDAGNTSVDLKELPK